ncbi:MAG: bifunctional diaminohydroxyphosphoribosylaminopyrimidine deaminase/5-amino-6-(5-phosphoribosylamino)uracil reductase RibD [Thermodesulfobacteriota bacterium]
MPKDPDVKYMSIALRFAKKAEGMTSPNPLVGAVLVKKGEILGKGYHKKAGLPHAEIEAFSDAEERKHNVKGSTLYVTLEPCCHTEKRTPPCVKTIIDKGILRVIVGTLDPNPKVNGKGIKVLREKGLEVKIGVLEDECRHINEGFFKHINTGTPFVILKLAATLDGKIATFTGDSKWIGSETQRKYAHKLRNKVDAVVVGVKTVLRDNPQLNVRQSTKSSHQPTPIVLDSRLRIPIQSHLLKIHESPIITTTPAASSNRLGRLRKIGARVLITDADETGRIDLQKLIEKLGEMGITTVLVEGGSEVAASFLKKKLVDKIVFFYAPKIIGAEGKSMIGRLAIPKISEALTIKEVKVKTMGGDFVVEGYTDANLSLRTK